MERVVIVGGGLLGCAVARELSGRGCEVLVLERAVVGAEASSAAAGILAPRIEAHGREPLRAIGIDSLDMYPAWIESLGVDVGFRRCGALVLRPDAPPDVDAEWVDDARAFEPALRPGGGWWLPREAVVDPPRLVAAVHAAAEGAGASFRIGVEVAHVGPEGVCLATGERISGRVVVCAGAWTSRVPGLAPLPVRPVRGQLVALSGAPLRGVVFGAAGYLVPRKDTVVAGTTVEDVGFERGVTAAGLAAVLAGAIELAPALGGAGFVRAWSGFRPGTPDDLPLLGEHHGVWVASGHYRNGILLAPFTARALAGAMLEGRALPPELSPARFTAR